MALAEMALGGFGTGELGVTASVTEETLDGLRPDKWLFTESSGFVMEVRAGDEQQVAEIFANHGLELLELGTVTTGPRFQIAAGPAVIDLPLDEAREAWTGGLAEALT